VQIASGIHPITHESIEPQRVLIVDAQEPAHVLRREMAWPIGLAGEDRVSTWTDEGGDLQRFLEDVVSVDAFDVIALGPLKKLTRLLHIPGDVTQSDETASAMTEFLDWLWNYGKRTLLIEAHPPRSTKRRSVIGPVRWDEWPDLGYSLTLNGTFTAWRPPRDQTGERRWPKRWTRNNKRTPGQWLYTVGSATTEDEHNDRWAALEDAYRSGARSLRAQAERLDVSKDTVARLRRAHADAWAALQADS
jgi:hypothetical protein